MPKITEFKNGSLVTTFSMEPSLSCPRCPGPKKLIRKISHQTQAIEFRYDCGHLATQEDAFEKIRYVKKYDSEILEKATAQEKRRIYHEQYGVRLSRPHGRST